MRLKLRLGTCTFFGFWSQFYTENLDFSILYIINSSQSYCLQYSRLYFDGVKFKHNTFFYIISRFGNICFWTIWTCWERTISRCKIRAYPQYVFKIKISIAFFRKTPISHKLDFEWGWNFVYGHAHIWDFEVIFTP